MNYSKAEIAANQFRKSYLIGEQEADKKFFTQLLKKYSRYCKPQICFKGR